jgi:hypothetical protein
MKTLSESTLRKRIREWTLFLIIAIFLSGLSAIPLRPEMNFLVQTFAQHDPPTVVDSWLLRVQAGVNDVSTRWPFLALGTDWLAFGHIVIGIGFIGLLRDPVRNEWLITWGLIACALVIPWAWCFGWARDIPWGWRLVDCSFGIGGMVPLIQIRRCVEELKRRATAGVQL